MTRAAILVALLTLPFHPFWMDMEQARRGWLLCLVGALLLLRPRTLLGPLRRAELWFAACLFWAALGILLDDPCCNGLLRLTHLTALFALFRWGRDQDATVWLRAILPTAIAVAAYGLLQRLGLPWPMHYAFTTEPVSTLGNLNVASEFTALGATAALLLLWRGERAWPVTALLLTTAYLVVNGSRSGMVASGAALVFLLLTTRGAQGWKIIAIAVGVLGFGFGMLLPGPGGERPAADQSPLTRTSTIEVRQEIWKSSLDMALEEPVFGHGPGQFATEYPRFRNPREIELSTNERRFRSSPRTVHNDPLELLVEGGVPGLVLAAGFLLSAALAIYRQSGLAQLAPLLCFVLLALVRSPLGNAPVAAWIMVYLGAMLPDPARDDAAVGEPDPPGPVRLWATRACGLFLLVLGTSVLTAQTLAAPYLSAKPSGQPPDPVHLERAVTWAPYDTRLHELLIQEYINPDPPDLEHADEHLETLAELAPHSPFRLLLVVQTALLSQDLTRAEEALDRLTELDPGDVEASTFRSTVHFLRGDHEAAIDAVYSNPHPRLREHLAEHLTQLEASAAQRGDPDTAGIYACERTFISVVDRLRVSSVAPTAVDDVLACFAAAGRLRRDIRPWILKALQFQALDLQSDIEDMARSASDLGLQLSDMHRTLFGDLLDRLQDSPGWRAILGG